MKTHDQDEWGKDPAVRAMRNLFRDMEQAHKDFLGRMEISPYDIRIRTWREKALIMFERAWGAINRMGTDVGIDTAADIYIHFFAKAMSYDGVEISIRTPPLEESIETLIKEFL